MGKRVSFASDFRPKKCARTLKEQKNVEDRISELPDDILICILSLLSLKEAASTSVLSKRWINLWTSRTVLDFYDYKVLDRILETGDGCPNKRIRESERLNFVRWVDKVLAQHNGCRLDEFKVIFDLCDSSHMDICRWIEFVLSKSPRKLELDLSHFAERLNECRTMFFFPKRILHWCRQQLLQKPNPLCSCVQPRGQVDLKSLISLCLKSVRVTGEVLEFFLRNCPFLEQLVVHGAHDLSSLEISGQSLALKHLEICYCSGMTSLVVRDTNLVFLKAMSIGDVHLENVDTLTDVYAGRLHLTESCTHTLSWLYSVLSQLVVLTLNIPKDDMGILKRYKFPELSKLQQFTLVVCSEDDESFLGATALIRAAPLLQRFVLQVQWLAPLNVTGTSKLQQALRITKRKYGKAAREPLQHLEVVEIWGYYGAASELELVMYFLKSAPALKKIIIDPRSRVYSRAAKYDLEEESESRIRAKNQLGRLLSPHVELVIF